MEIINVQFSKTRKRKRMSATIDVFGIKKVYRDRTGGPGWDARHWSGNGARTVKSGDKDPFDPMQCSENRGNVTWSIDGNGHLDFNGTKSGTTEPRFHLNNPCKYFFRDVECTYYMKRIVDTNVNWGGCCLGVRSGPNGHSIPSEYCDAHTYYQRIRNDGYMDFEKELKHPDSSVKGRNNVFGGERLPKNQWIGYKSVTRNAGNGVKLQLFMDLTEGANGGDWKLIGSMGDTNRWAPPQSQPECSYKPDFVPLLGGGVIVLRNTGCTDCKYKWMSVREITSSMIPGSWSPNDLQSFEMEAMDDIIDTNENFEDGIVEQGSCCDCDYVEPSSPVECINCEGGRCELNSDNSTNYKDDEAESFFEKCRGVISSLF
jgi:hypothetical protein